MFWKASLVDFLRCVEGFNKMHDTELRRGFSDEERQEVEKLKAKYG
ncbi:hypothetical protein [uncultured Roseibium sp.]|nr:hypothetical protein [uncultured Roseibium sp.]